MFFVSFLVSRTLITYTMFQLYVSRVFEVHCHPDSLEQSFGIMVVYLDGKRWLWIRHGSPMNPIRRVHNIYFWPIFKVTILTLQGAWRVRRKSTHDTLPSNLHSDYKIFDAGIGSWVTCWNVATCAYSRNADTRRWCSSVRKWWRWDKAFLHHRLPKGKCIFNLPTFSTHARLPGSSNPNLLTADVMWYGVQTLQTSCSQGVTVSGRIELLPIGSQLTLAMFIALSILPKQFLWSVS